jgi:hypothetical protein
MAAASTLMDRINAEFSETEARVKQLQSERVQAYHDRQQRLEKFEKTLEGMREIWRPRLETLAQKFGEKVDVKPSIERAKRSGTFAFKSPLAHIKLRFAVSPDEEVRNAIFTYDLEILPILMRFDSHDEISVPIERVDEKAIGAWLDDRIISFVKTYLLLHENQYYLKDHLVEDPVAKVKFPKFAAGATLDVNGKTLYFIDDSTCREFKQKQR